MESIELEKVFKVLGDQTRLRILSLIYQGQKCGCELISSLDIRQPTLSHHLKVLSDAGFIVGVKEKNRVNYTVDLKRFDGIFEALKVFIAEEKVDC